MTMQTDNQRELKPCRCGGESYHQIIPAHTHHLAKHMPDAEDSEFVSCYQCSAMTSSVDDWNRIMGDDTRASAPAVEAPSDLVERWNQFAAECRDALTAVIPYMEGSTFSFSYAKRQAQEQIARCEAAIAALQPSATQADD